MRSNRTGAEFVSAIRAAYDAKNLQRPYFILISGDSICVDGRGGDYFDEQIEKPISFKKIKQSIGKFYECSYGIKSLGLNLII